MRATNLLAPRPEPSPEPLRSVQSRSATRPLLPVGVAKPIAPKRSKPSLRKIGPGGWSNEVREPQEIVERLAFRAETLHAIIQHKLGRSLERLDRFATVLLRVRFWRVIEAEAATSGIDPLSLVIRTSTGHLRRGPYVAIRHRIWRRLRLEGFSTPEIAAAFGTSHSTILAATRKEPHASNESI